LTKEYCDICEADIEGFDFKDYFGGREYRLVERRTCDKWDDVRTLTLCRTCAERMNYYMRNKHVLSDRIASLSLKNRIRILFRRPLKDEHYIDEQRRVHGRWLPYTVQSGPTAY